jgi:hypothetical protein
MIVGSRAILNDVFDSIHNTFFDNEDEPNIDIDELKIINN